MTSCIGICLFLCSFCLRQFVFSVDGCNAMLYALRYFCSDNIQLLSNRSAANIKLSKFKEALKDAVKCTKLNSSLSKSWGRLGGALYGMGNYK